MSLTKPKTATALLLAASALGVGILWFTRSAAAPDSGTSEDRPPAVYAVLLLGREEHLLNDAESARPPSDSEVARWRRTQAALLKSRLVIAHALRLPEVKDLPLVQQQRDPVAWLEKTLRVDFLNDSDLLRVGMSGFKPEEMVIIVNGITKGYMDEVGNGERRQQLSHLNDIDKACIRAEEKIREQRHQLRALADKLGTHDPASPGQTMEQQLQVQRLQECTHEQHRMELEKVVCQVRLARRQAVKKGAEELPTVNQLEEQIAVLTAQEKLLGQEKEELQRQVDRSNATSFELLHKQKELEQAEQTLRQLLTAKERLQVEVQSSRLRVNVIQPAEAPGSK